MKERAVTVSGVRAFLQGEIERLIELPNVHVNSVAFTTFDSRLQYQVMVGKRWHDRDEGQPVRVRLLVTVRGKVLVDLDARRWVVSLELYVPDDLDEALEMIPGYAKEWQQELCSSIGETCFYERTVGDVVTEGDARATHETMTALQRLVQCGCGRPAMARSEEVARTGDVLCSGCTLTLLGSEAGAWVEGHECLLCLGEMRRGHMATSSCCGVKMHRSCFQGLEGERCIHCQRPRWCSYA